MAKLFNLARMTTATVGVGTITLGAAVSGFLTFAQAGVANGDVVAYGIQDGANSEVGTGTYTSSGTTLTRTVLASTNGGAAISLSGSAQVYITALKEQIANLGEDNNFTGNQSLNGIALLQMILPRVRVAATSNITIASGLTNGTVIDGVTLATGDIVLLAAQTTAAQNGLYTVVASGAASRTPNFTAYDTLAGGAVTVMEGTKEADSMWYCTSNKGGTIGSTSLAYVRARPLNATPSFNVTNAANQTLPDASFTAVAFDTENADVGGYFASNVWTPPKGTILLIGSILVGGTFTVGATVAFSIGGLQISGAAQSTSAATVNGSVMTTANGSQTFGMVVYADVASGSPNLNGGGNLIFAGVWLGP